MLDLRFFQILKIPVQLAPGLVLSQHSFADMINVHFYRACPSFLQNSKQSFFFSRKNKFSAFLYDPVYHYRDRYPVKKTAE